MKLTLTLLICLAAFSMVVTSGCNDTVKPEAIGTPEQAKDMLAARKIFDENKGDWAKTPPEQQAKFEQYVGGKEKAQAVWAKMLNPYAPGPGAVKPQGATGAKNPFGG